MPFETWEVDNKRSLTFWIVLVLITSLVFVGIAVAVYKITSPPSDPVTVSAAATLSKPTVNATACVIGDTIQISTTLSDQAEGLQVIFFENGIQVGSAYTNSLGEAIFNRLMTAGGTFTYVAECTRN